MEDILFQRNYLLWAEIVSISQEEVIILRFYNVLFSFQQENPQKYINNKCDNHDFYNTTTAKFIMVCFYVV